jgi:4-hydroxybenzoate polyprenyltransferase
MVAIRPWLQLVRLPNLFTAAADPLAGFLLAGGLLRERTYSIPLMGAGAAIYAGGMVLNDVFDLDLDRVERPERPLPAGRIAPRHAAVVGAMLLLLGPILAALSSARPVALAVALAGCVIAYDAVARRLWVGPFVMGLCRMLNLAVGLQAGRIAFRAPPLNFDFDALTPSSYWGILVGYGLFVAGITWISRTENHSGRTRGLALGLGLQLAALAILCGTLVRDEDFLHSTLFWRDGIRWSLGQSLWLLDTSSLGSQIGLTILAVVISLVVAAGMRVWQRPTPGAKRAAVRTGVLSLVWILAALVFCTGNPSEGLAVAALAVPARLLARMFPPT